MVALSDVLPGTRPPRRLDRARRLHLLLALLVVVDRLS